MPGNSSGAEKLDVEPEAGMRGKGSLGEAQRLAVGPT